MNFIDGHYKSETGETIEVKLVNGILYSRFSCDTRFTELLAQANDWSYGAPDYSIRPFGDDILLCKGYTIGLNPELYKRI